MRKRIAPVDFGEFGDAVSSSSSSSSGTAAAETTAVATAAAASSSSGTELQLNDQQLQLHNQKLQLQEAAAAAAAAADEEMDAAAEAYNKAHDRLSEMSLVLFHRQDNLIQANIQHEEETMDLYSTPLSRFKLREKKDQARLLYRQAFTEFDSLQHETEKARARCKASFKEYVNTQVVARIAAKPEQPAAAQAHWTRTRRGRRGGRRRRKIEAINEDDRQLPSHPVPVPP